MKKFVLLVLVWVTVISCNTNELEFDNITVDPIQGDYVVPLGDIIYTMRDLLEQQEDEELDLQEDSTSFLTLFYADTIAYGSDGDFVTVDDITQSGEVTVPASGGGVTVPITQTFSLAYENQPGNEEDLDSVFYNTGTLSLVTTSDLPGILNFSYTINNTINTNTNNPLVLNGTLNGPGTDDQTVNLINYKTTLNDNNQFVVDFDGSVTLGPGDMLTGNEELRFDLTYANQTFSLIYGKFGQDTVTIGNGEDQTLDLSFFEDSGADGLFFGNPIMRFNFENSFGIPIGLDFSGIAGDDGEGGNVVNLSGDITEAPLPEMLAPTTPGEVAQSTIEINRSNSNIVGLLQTSPTRMIFNVDGISNANDITQSNFVRPGAGDNVEAIIELEVPMEVRLENFQQELDYTLGADGLDTANVEDAFLRIVTINGLPFSGTLGVAIQDVDSVQVWPLDENGDPSVVEELVLNSPFIDFNGLVTDENGTATDIPLGPDGVAALATPDGRLVFTVTLNTPASQTSRDIFVKVLADYQLEIKIGLGGTVRIPID